MSAAGPLPRRSLPQPPGEGTPVGAAGPLPRRSLPQPPGEGTPVGAAGPLPRRSLPQPSGEGTPVGAAGPLPRRSLPQPSGEGTPVGAAGPLPRRSLPQPSGEGTPVSGPARPASLAGQCRQPSSCLSNADRYESPPSACPLMLAWMGAARTGAAPLRAAAMPRWVTRPDNRCFA